MQKRVNLTLTTINYIYVIITTIFWVIWKERKLKAFEGKEIGAYRLRDVWYRYFGSIMLGYDIIKNENFENAIDTLTHL